MIGSKRLIPDQVKDSVKRNDGSICKNLELLDPISITTLSTLGNLRIGNFGGIFESQSYTSTEEESETQNFIRSEQVSKFINKSKPTSKSLTQHPIDILLTYSLPQLLTVHSKLLPKDPNAPAWGCPPITEILRASQPRYHFAGGPQSEFWEREPWLWDKTSIESDSQPLITRFVHLAEFGNPEKERWFYAFNISPIDEVKPVRPSNATACPYSLRVDQSRKRNANDMADDVFESGQNFRFGSIENNQKKTRTGVTPPNYVCKICSTSGHWIQDCPEKQQQKRKPQEGYVCRICNTPGHLINDCPMAEKRKADFKDRTKFQHPKEIGPDTCWFCLSNPQVAKHLIVSIGSETYVSLPKGQLPDTKSGCLVPGGGHVLIIPIAHYPSLLGVSSELSVPILKEIEEYKASLNKCYQSFECSPISFEVVRLSGKGAKAGHFHLQVCPIPNRLIQAAEKAFAEEAKNQNFEFEAGDDLDDVLKDLVKKDRESLSYFKVVLPLNGKVLIHLIKPNEKFNLQFGRICLDRLLRNDTILTNQKNPKTDDEEMELGREKDEVLKRIEEVERSEDDQKARWDWKKCERSEEDESQDCLEFKKAFKSFEPDF
ncbi:CwfJ C-terminus 1-domain-containing protein-like protein [Phakopsora pachyrhizi]|nr:CwfJ C-terminus 1-domain-containing protein-like protein [Phakopsora pachyrhizi]